VLKCFAAEFHHITPYAMSHMSAEDISVSYRLSCYDNRT